MKQSKVKRGNSLVDLDLFRERMEELTNHAKQKEIEEKADIKQGGLSRLYYGEDTITVDHLIKISKAYNCSIDYLLGRDEIEKKKDVSVKDIIEMVHALCEMDSIEMIDEYEWPNTNDTYKSVGLYVKNSKLNTVLVSYCALRKALNVVYPELKKQMYNIWLESELRMINGYKEYSVNGATINPRLVSLDEAFRGPFINIEYSEGEDLPSE